MKEEHGNIKELSSANKSLPLLIKTAYYVGTRPLNLIVYGITWFHLYSLCQFGRLHKNIPVLCCCIVWWAGTFGYAIRLWLNYNRHKIPAVFRALRADENMLTIAEAETDGGAETGAGAEKSFTGEDVRWYIRRKDSCQIFLRDKTVFVLDLREIAPDERNFLDLKLSTVHMLHKREYRMAAGLFLAAVTLFGGFLVVRSAIPYHGKLSWYLSDLRDKRNVTLRHDNVYETGIEGILEDVREKVELPERLCLATSFNLHFAPDGKIISLDTMLYGFDEDGSFIDSYLISYPSGPSRKISVYLHGSAGALYDAGKDLQPLVEAVSAMPLEATVSEWNEESCFGILYYGTREWYSREGICYLNHEGECRTPPMEEQYFSGYSISVFCPENEALTPVRYLYMGYQMFPEEEPEYTADYYPETENAYVSDYYPDEDAYAADYYLETKDSYTAGYDSVSQKIHATGNFWRTCEDYPTEQYGKVSEEEKSYYTDKNGEEIYWISYRNFRMDETVRGADKINRFLEEKERAVRNEWQKNANELMEYGTEERKHPYGYSYRNHPYDSMEFRALTYLEGSYCSLVFFGQNYTGGVSASPTVYAYTIDVSTGEEVRLWQIAPQITEEQWMELIDRAFEEEQGFHTLFSGSEEEQTAGECWYRSYRDGEWGSGLYLTGQGIVFYYGFSQITWRGNGAIEVIVPWEDINGQ